MAELRAISAPVLIVPGADVRHPTALAEQVATAIPHGVLGSVTLSHELLTAEDLGEAMAPALREFLAGL
ncbi:hypothetical protein [Streptomyces jumonjinensis]|uniref:hypothetical protein n=1 Tax=Streptomyces jumonjinensis TaxID=1945 RepID=UPI001E490D48|nr:hypothetical protein [Streptomyces jumonjinensis]